MLRLQNIVINIKGLLFYMAPNLKQFYNTRILYIIFYATPFHVLTSIKFNLLYYNFWLLVTVINILQKCINWNDQKCRNTYHSLKGINCIWCINKCIWSYSRHLRPRYKNKNWNYLRIIKYRWYSRIKLSKIVIKYLISWPM